MSSHISVQVLVSLLLINLFASAQMYGYPTQYSQPYPYMQQYPSFGGDANNFGVQGYPQVYPQNYPYPYQPIYPSVLSYAPQYPSYPSYPPVSFSGSVPQTGYSDRPQYPVSGLPAQYPDQSQYPSSGLPAQYPSGTNVYPSSGLPAQYPSGTNVYPSSGLPAQYPSGTNVYPSNYPVPTPQLISTPYGNIPVEIIDVDGSIERQVGITGQLGLNTKEDTESTKLTPILNESKSVFDVLSNPTKSTKYVKTEPTQTKIVRTLEPESGKIHVEVQTNSPLPTKEKNDNNEEDNEEDNETTTKWNIFG